MEQLAKALREEMDRRNHSFRDAGDEMGVSYNTVRNWSKGWVAHSPRMEHWQALAEYLGVPLYHVLGLVGILTEEQVDHLRAIPGSLASIDAETLKMLERAGYLVSLPFEALIA